jgi:HK97 gp10 family phage protein
LRFLIEGAPEVSKILREIAPKHAQNLMRATIHGVASKIAKDAAQRAQKGLTGTLKKAIIAKREKSNPDYPRSSVYVRHGKTQKYDAFYWRFVEFGTKNGARERPFIRPARDAANASFKQDLVTEFGIKLEKALAREAKKTAKKKG